MITLRLPSHFPVRSTEWMLACMKVSWGFILLSPNNMFETNPYLKGLEQIAPQNIWGLVALILGSIHLSALWINGTRQKTPHLRAFCSGFGALFWFQVTLGIYNTGLISPGWAVYPYLFAFSVYNVVRAMSDAAASDARENGKLIGDSA
jgi:hypothetical protein